MEGVTILRSYTETTPKEEKSDRNGKRTHVARIGETTFVTLTKENARSGYWKLDVPDLGIVCHNLGAGELQVAKNKAKYVIKTTIESRVSEFSNLLRDIVSLCI